MHRNGLLGLCLSLVAGLALWANGQVMAQTAGPVRVGDVIRSSTVPPGWWKSGSTCNEAFTVCASVLQKRSEYLLVQTKPVNHRIGQPVVEERVLRVTRFAPGPGETSGWNCYVDDQSPVLVFVPSHRKSVRAIILDKSGNYVEVQRRLTPPNWCEFDNPD